MNFYHKVNTIPTLILFTFLILFLAIISVYFVLSPYAAFAIFNNVSTKVVKIIQSFIHVTNGNRGNLFMKYICFKKKEILLNMMNNIHIDCFRKIILMGHGGKS